MCVWTISDIVDLGGVVLVIIFAILAFICFIIDKIRRK